MALRLTNIALHEQAFNKGSQNGLRSIGNQHMNDANVNIQGPTVSEVNAIFSPNGVQLQATMVNMPGEATSASMR